VKRGMDSNFKKAVDRINRIVRIKRPSADVGRKREEQKIRRLEGEP
jgi:hypothetical protein